MIPDDTSLDRTNEFFLRPFAIDYLYPVFGELSVDTLFDGWVGRKIGVWYKFENNNGDIIEFYPEQVYVIRNATHGVTYQLRTPNTIGEFIHDMEKFGVRLSLA